MFSDAAKLSSDPHAGSAEALPINLLYERFLQGLLSRRKEGELRSALEQAAEYRWLDTPEYIRLMKDFIPLTQIAGKAIRWKEPLTLKEPANRGFLRGEFTGTVDGDPHTIMKARWHTRVGNYSSLHGIEPSWVIERTDKQSKTTDVAVFPPALASNIRETIAIQKTLPQHPLLNPAVQRPLLWTEPGGQAWISAEFRDLLVKAVRFKEVNGQATKESQVISPNLVGGQIWGWIEKCIEPVLDPAHFRFAPRQEAFQLLAAARKVGGIPGRQFEEALFSDTRSINDMAARQFFAKLRGNERRELLNALERLDPEAALRLAILPGSKEILGREAARLRNKRLAPEPHYARKLVLFGGIGMLTAAGTLAGLRGVRYVRERESPRSVLSMPSVISSQDIKILVKPDEKSSRSYIREVTFSEGFFYREEDEVVSSFAGKEIQDSVLGNEVTPVLFISPLFIPMERESAHFGVSSRIHAIVPEGDRMLVEVRFQLRSEKLEEKLLQGRSSGVTPRLVSSDISVSVEQHDKVYSRMNWVSPDQRVMSIWLECPISELPEFNDILENLTLDFWYSSIDDEDPDKSVVIKLDEYASSEEVPESYHFGSDELSYARGELDPLFVAASVVRSLHEILATVDENCDSAGITARAILAKVSSDDSEEERQFHVPSKWITELEQLTHKTAALVARLNQISEKYDLSQVPQPEAYLEAMRDGAANVEVTPGNLRKANEILTAIRECRLEFEEVLPTLSSLQVEAGDLFQGQQFITEQEWLRRAAENLHANLYLINLLLEQNMRQLAEKEEASDKR